jgi:hypothetical protein
MFRVCATEQTRGNGTAWRKCVPGVPSSLSHRDPIGLTCTMKNNEALHMCELRTMPQGHPDYRFICHEMWRKTQEVHPALADAGRFIERESTPCAGCSRR